MSLNTKTKRRRKVFKKWLMYKGYSRDEAEVICNIIGKENGKLSYAECNKWFTLIQYH